jgi:hypothetical protein
LTILARREVERPRSLGLVPATAGYIDPADREAIVDVQSSPKSTSPDVTRQA